MQQYDIKFVPSGSAPIGRAYVFAAMAELDKLLVLGPPESMPRRRLLAESSGAKGAIKLLNDEQKMLDEQAAIQEQMAIEQALMQEQAAQQAALAGPSMGAGMPDLGAGAPPMGMPPEPQMPIGGIQ